MCRLGRLSRRLGAGTLVPLCALRDLVAWCQYERKVEFTHHPHVTRATRLNKKRTVTIGTRTYSFVMYRYDAGVSTPRETAHPLATRFPQPPLPDRHSRNTRFH